MSFPEIRGVSRETQDVLASYAQMLLQWNATHNLISKNSEKDLWLRHIEDSIQVYNLAPDAQTWIDFGSGAGLPGVVAAILAKGQGRETAFTLVESNRKKAIFLRAAARAFDLKINVENHRIESVDSQPYDVISARALASLTQLLAYAERFAEAGAICLFPKGRTVEQELAEAKKDWKIRLQSHPSRTDDASVILRIEEFHHV